MTDVLTGVRVVELSTVITAPLTGLMLADLGADVIKVEPRKATRSGVSAAGNTARTSSPTTAASAAFSSTCAPKRADPSC